MNQQTLLNALSIVAPVANDKGTMPILGNVLFKDGRVMATDTIQRVEAPLDCPIDNMAVPAKKLLTIIKSAPKNADINLTQIDNSVTVQFGKSRYTIPTLPVQDFPTPPVNDPVTSFSILDNVLTEAVQSVIRQCGKDDVRYFLNGANLEIKDGTATIVGTNGHKLAAWSSSLDADDVSVILSRECIDHLSRIKPTGEEVKVTITAVDSVFEFGDRIYAARMIDGKFPDWRRVVPDGGENVTFDRDAMLDACRRANALFQDVRLTFTGTACEISAESKDGERAIDEIEAKSAALEPVAFNAQYLVEALGTLSEGEITMRVNGDTGPAALEDDEGGLVQVVMPVRI